ncbi:MAG TPA: polymer-forming cytoskeletal protein [Polyangiaceae bacterium]|nr:polymer-forming cytoskeletal protein [Polyangiaceae bacterium]
MSEPQPGAPRSALEASAREFHALLGPGTSWSGRLSFAGRVRVEAAVEGEILGGELVVIAGEADVQGTIQADHVLVLGGRVRANITARKSIELCIPAVVEGDLRAPDVFLERGVSFTGRCTMGHEAAELV